MTEPNEERVHIERLLTELIEDIKAIRDGEWEKDNYIVSMDKDADVTPIYDKNGVPGGFLRGPVVTDFKIETPNGLWKITHQKDG